MLIELADEIEAAISKAESKRRELEEAAPTAKAGATSRHDPEAAELHRRHIAAGLKGDPGAVLTARVALRGLLIPFGSTPRKMAACGRATKCGPAH